MKSPTLTLLLEEVKIKLGWNDVDFVQIQGVIYVGSTNGPRIKRLLPISSDLEWTHYKVVVLACEVRSLDLVVSKESSVRVECRSSPTRVDGSPSLEEELFVTQPCYGDSQVLVSQEHDEYGGAEGLGFPEHGVGWAEDDRYAEDNTMEHRDVQGNTDNEDNDDSYVIGDSEHGLDDASGDDSIYDDLSDEDDLSGEEEFFDARATN